MPTFSVGYAFWFAVLVLGAALFFYLSRREKKLVDRNPDPWTDPLMVNNTLILALDQGAIFRILPSDSDTAFHFPPVYGLCAYLDRQRLIFRAKQPSASQLSSVRAGDNVRIDFCVFVAGLPRTFRFHSMILRGDVDGDGDFWELIRPARLERWRRRAFDRVSPLRSEVLALGVWDYSLFDGTGPLPSVPTVLPSPLLVFRPGKAENVRLADISASGIGLRVNKDTLATLVSGTGCLRGCLLIVSLRESGSSPLTLWLVCARCHATSRAARPSSVMLGFKIVHWAKTVDASAPVLWHPTASNGETPPLLRWTLQRRAVPRRFHLFHL